MDVEPPRPISLKDEQYMSSREWLQIYGLDARKLGLYDVLGGVAFKHLDGVIDIMQPPPTDSQTDAVRIIIIILTSLVKMFKLIHRMRTASIELKATMT